MACRLFLARSRTRRASSSLAGWLAVFLEGLLLRGIVETGNASFLEVSPWWARRTSIDGWCIKRTRRGKMRANCCGRPAQCWVTEYRVYELLGGHVNCRFKDLMLKIPSEFSAWALLWSCLSQPRLVLVRKFSHGQAFRIVQHVGTWVKDGHKSTCHARDHPWQHVTTDSHTHRQHGRYCTACMSSPSDPGNPVADPVNGKMLLGGQLALPYTYAGL